MNLQTYLVFILDFKISKAEMKQRRPVGEVCMYDEHGSLVSQMPPPAGLVRLMQMSCSGLRHGLSRPHLPFAFISVSSWPA